jgi:hypothetical protein
MSEERWLPVVGYEGLYEVSDQGRVRSLDRVLEQTDFAGNVYSRRFQGRILKWKYCAKGPYGRWCTVCLGRGAEGPRKYLLVHRAVLTAFVGECPEGHEGAHNDGNPENNRLLNLRWDTHSGNQKDMARHGRQYTGGASKLSQDQAQEIRRAVASGASMVSQAKRFGLAITKGHAQSVAAIVHGRTYS